MIPIKTAEPGQLYLGQFGIAILSRQQNQLSLLKIYGACYA